jgi:hypothetical protein
LDHFYIPNLHRLFGKSQSVLGPLSTAQTTHAVFFGQIFTFFDAKPAIMYEVIVVVNNFYCPHVYIRSYQSCRQRLLQVIL